MNTKLPSLVLAIHLSAFLAQAQDFRIQPTRGDVAVKWTIPAPPTVPHAVVSATHRLWTSQDLQTWKPLGQEITDGVAGLRQSFLLADAPGQLFFRLETKTQPSYLAQNGADGFGFNAVLRERLVARSGLTPEAFPPLFPTGQRLERISYDPTQSKFWAEFATDPAAYNAQLPPTEVDKRLTDFRLNEPELALFKKNGFVVSGRLGSYSFADVFYRVWMDDLPVYVSADSVLHAWHKTFVRMLEEIEELVFRPRLESILSGMRASLQAARNLPAAGNALRESFRDADVMINVAERLLLTLDAKSPVLQACAFPESQALANEFYQDALAAIKVGNYGGREIFGESGRFIDFTQCKPRGHYVNSPTLSAYFRAMQWLGQVDFRIAGGSPIAKGNARQLGAAVVMSLLLSFDSAKAWQEMDTVLRALVGEVDSLTPPQLLAVLAADKLDSFAAWQRPEQLTNLTEKILAGTLGMQNVPGQLVWAPLHEEKIVFPRSFTLIGQRFVVDGWATAETVFDRMWTTDAEGQPVRVLRRLTSALDIGFAVLGNNTTANLLAERMTRANGVRFRDGLPYAFHLAAVRDTLDALPASAWQSTTYNRWLGALRTLSAPVGKDAAYLPEVFRTTAWDWSTLNTQLASWTQLRHNSILYAKATYTPPTICSYPDGYVEPRPDFWAAMKDLAANFQAVLNAVPMEGERVINRSVLEFGQERLLPSNINIAHVKASWLAHLGLFGQTMDKLRVMAEAHLAGQTLDAAQVAFMEGLIQRFSRDSGGTARTYAGWYPKLFYMGFFPQLSEPGQVNSSHPSDEFDAIVTDVHSDAPDDLTGDPGAIIHQGVGQIPLMLLTIQHPTGERCTYAGPVLSHYEFLKPWAVRTTDAEWKAEVISGKIPAPPEWTASFLVPGSGSFTPVDPMRQLPFGPIP